MRYLILTDDIPWAKAPHNMEGLLPYLQDKGTAVVMHKEPESLEEMHAHLTAAAATLTELLRQKKESACAAA